MSLPVVHCQPQVKHLSQPFTYPPSTGLATQSLQVYHVTSWPWRKWRWLESSSCLSLQNTATLATPLVSSEWLLVRKGMTFKMAILSTVSLSENTELFLHIELPVSNQLALKGWGMARVSCYLWNPDDITRGPSRVKTCRKLDFMSFHISPQAWFFEFKVIFFFLLSPFNTRW